MHVKFEYCPGSIWVSTIIHCFGSVNSQGPPKDPHNNTQQRRVFQSLFQKGLLIIKRFFFVIFILYCYHYYLYLVEVETNIYTCEM